MTPAATATAALFFLFAPLRGEDAPAEVSPATTASDSAAAPGKDGRKTSPEEVEALISKLLRIRDAALSDDRRRVAEMIKTLDAVIASGGNSDAMKLWSDSLREIEFTSKGKSFSDFEAWRKKNVALLHDGGAAFAIKLRCRYLRLCLSCDTKEKADAAFPRVVAMEEEAIRALGSATQEVVGADVFGDAIAHRFKIEKFKPKGWSGSLLAIPAYFRHVLDTALENKATAPDTVLKIWELRLPLEQKLAAANAKTAAGTPTGKPTGSKSPDQSSAAEAEAALNWEMAEDFHSAGLQRRGFEIMYGIILKNLKSGNADGRIKRMMELAEAAKTGEAPPKPKSDRD